MNQIFTLKGFTLCVAHSLSQGPNSDKTCYHNGELTGVIQSKHNGCIPFSVPVPGPATAYAPTLVTPCASSALTSDL